MVQALAGQFSHAILMILYHHYQVLFLLKFTHKEIEALIVSV